MAAFKSVYPSPNYGGRADAESWQIDFSHPEVSKWDRARRNMFWVGFYLMKNAVNNEDIEPIAVGGKPDLLCEAVKTVIHFVMNK